MKKLTGNIIKKNISKTLGVHKDHLRIVRFNSSNWKIYISDFEIPIKWYSTTDSNEYTGESLQESSDLFNSKLKGKVFQRRRGVIKWNTPPHIYSINIDDLLKPRQLEYKLDLLRG